MVYSFIDYLGLGLVAVLISGLSTPLARKLALRIGAMDKPNLERKAHKAPVPYLGGLSIALTVTVLIYGVTLARGNGWADLKLASYVVIPALILAAIGLVDDLRGLQPWPRLIAQTVAGITVATILISTDTMGFVFRNNWIDGGISILWIVGICNAINFFDNLDGGASGTVGIIGIAIFLIAFWQGQILVGGLSIVMAGAVFGFLFWNKSPAKIYMGDAGALFLGVLVAVLTIRMNPGITPNWKSLAIPPLLLAIPILDTTVAVISRWRRGISAFTGGRDHLSHRLIRISLEHRTAAFTLWALTAFFCAIALAVYKLSGMTTTLIIIFAGAIWLALATWFLRIPATDSKA